MLSETLQAEITTLLATINAQHQDLRREKRKRPNFEPVYDDVLLHPEKPSYRMESTLLYHADENIAKLTIVCRNNLGETWFGDWEIEVQPVFADMVFMADSASDAIRLAQKEIKAREADFLEYYASDALSLCEEKTPTPSPSPKHQGGES